MSVRISNVVWKEARQSGGELLVLLALANIANDDGLAWPSLETIAQDARMTIRNAQRALRSLEAAGVLSVERAVGRSNTSRYTIHVAALKGDNLPPLKGEELSPRKGDNLSAEKGDNLSEKVTSETEKVTFSVIKGDAGVTQPVLTVKEPLVDTAAEPPPALVPYRLFQVLCAELGADESSATEGEKKKQLGIAKQLIADGVTEADVRGCLHYLLSQRAIWRVGFIDLATVRSEVGKWRMAGRPEREPTPLRPPRPRVATI